MKRRNILAAAFFALTASLMPLTTSAAEGTEGFVEYSPEALKNSLNSGETVFLDFKASWCPTCAAQGRVIEELRAKNPAYDKNITFMLADWDQWGKSQIVNDLRIPRRSTLVLLRGNKELARVVAGTSNKTIKTLLDKGLKQ